MAIDEIKHFLLWCAAINYAVLLIWFLVFVFARDWMYAVHRRWFKLSLETFDVVHYSGMAVYKVGILLFNLVPLAALTLVSPGVATPAPIATAVPQLAATASPVQFLLESAATDFHAHPPVPVGFREVRAGHVTAANGTTQYMLCGLFLPPAPAGGQADWTPFVTLKTSGYEQWLGGQAVAFCQQPSMVWDEGGDLSGSLLSRLDAMR